MISTPKASRFRWSARSPRAARWFGLWLIRQGRFDEADALLDAALRAHPDHPRLVVPHAFVAHQVGRHVEALKRWSHAATIRPDNTMTWCGIASNARSLGDMVAARRALLEGFRRHPESLVLMSEAARIADAEGRHEEGLAHWRKLTAQARTHAEDWLGFIHDLVRLGRVDEGAAALREAKSRHAGESKLLIAEAILAVARGDLTAAMTIVRAFMRQFPDDPSGRNLLGHIMMERGLAIIDGLTEEAVVDVGHVENDEIRTLLLGFESLGADCEFGLVQRRFGAEPLGLLRWSDVQLPGLRKALAARFADMGSSEQTLMTIDPCNEYYVCDARWGLGMHTFLSSTEVDSLALLPKMCRRVAFLRDKLVGDLETAEKVFIWKGDAIDLVGLRSLHAALTAFGSVRLINVRAAQLPGWDGMQGEPGTIACLAPRLHVGWLSRLGNAGKSWDIAFDEWIALCRSIVVAEAAEA